MDKKINKLKDKMQWNNRHKKVGIAVRTSSSIQKNYIPKNSKEDREWF